MEELRTCQEERDILKQKLHIHLDRWTLDKIRFEEMSAKAAREIHRQEAERSFETARREIHLGSQQQQLLVLKMKLDSALEDLQSKEIQFSALKSQFQEERKWFDCVNETLRQMKASFGKQFAREHSKLVTEIERNKHLQKLLDDKARSRKAEVEQIEGRHALIVTQLKEEIKHLVSRDDDAKSQQIHRSIERKKMYTLVQERDYLRGEVEKWNLRFKEMEAINDERDGLLAEKHRFMSREHEMRETLMERDKLKAQLENFISNREDQELVKQRDKLKHELELTNARREDEVSALVRERDFVWTQMKNLDDDYAMRIKTWSDQNTQDRQEIERLKNEIKAARVGNNELMVEMTILKLEVKRVEDLAIQKQGTLEAELQDLQSNLWRLKEEKQTRNGDLKKESLLKVPLERQLNFSYQGQVAEPVGDGSKEVPEVLNAGDGPTQEPESQIEQATQVHRDEERKSSVYLADLRRENENLRRENENLKVLYAELEDALREKLQKPAKANKVNHRDPTSRNLKLELEAAASCYPAGESPVMDGNLQEKKRNLAKPRPGPRTNLTLRKIYEAPSKAGPEDGHFSEHVEVSKRYTRRLKGMPTNGESPSDENIFVPSPKKLRPRTRVDYSDPIGLDIAVDKKSQNPGKKRKTKDTDFQSIQNQRLPLHTLPHNLRSSTKPAVRTLSSSKETLPESSNKSFVGSPTKTSKGMVNYFSTAFNVPKLKTPAHFMT